MSTRLETRIGVVAATLALTALALLPQVAPTAAAAEQLAPRAEVQRWLDIRTVPLVVGAAFELDGQVYTTGFDGAVSIPTSGLTQVATRLHFVGTPTDDPTLQSTFIRFSLPPQQGYRRPADRGVRGREGRAVPVRRPVRQRPFQPTG